MSAKVIQTKVALINPPVIKNEVWVREGRCQQYDIWGAPFPPLSLAYIAGQINELAENKIIDAGAKRLSLEETIDKLLEFKPSLVILSVATPTIESDLGWFAHAIKKSLPETKIAAIGIHVTALPKETLETFSDLDFIICGEPEVTSKELVKAIIANGNYDQIEGLAFKKDGLVCINKNRPFAASIDEFAFPDWSKINVQDYLMPIKNKPFLLINFARGCPYQCSFCATQTYNGKKVRRRSIEGIIEEIKYDMGFGVRDFLFWTEQFTLDRNYTEQFLDTLITSGLNKEIRWVCNSRVDMVDRGLLDKMKKAGCWQIAFGLEFGNDTILCLANKRTTVAQGKKAIRLTAQAGIVADGHFIMGYPGETVQTMRDTIRLACQLPLTFAHFYAATPFPGSKLYEESREKLLNNVKWSSISQDTPLFSIDNLTQKEIRNLFKQAYHKFYLRPITFFRVLNIPKKITEIPNLINLGIKFIKVFLK